MASVTLDHLWIQRASDPTDYVKVYLERKREATDRRGEVREYAGGRLRAFSRPGQVRKWQGDLQLITTSDYASLIDLQDVLVLWRDHLGDKMYGRYFQLDADRQRGPSGQVRRVRIRFEEVTHSEVV